MKFSDEQIRDMLELKEDLNEKIIPFGFNFFIFSTEVSNGKSSAYTEKSLIRLHIR